MPSGRAKVEPYPDPLHALRKSCVDYWARRHPPNVVREWAGHASVSTTMRYYARVGREDELRAQGPAG